MRMYKTTSGYVFKMFSRGEICKVINTDKTVRVIECLSELTRQTEVEDVETGKKSIVNSADLELVSQSIGVQQLENTAKRNRDSKR